DATGQREKRLRSEPRWESASTRSEGGTTGHGAETRVPGLAEGAPTESRSRERVVHDERVRARRVDHEVVDRVVRDEVRIVGDGGTRRGRERKGRESRAGGLALEIAHGFGVVAGTRPRGGRRRRERPRRVRRHSQRRAGRVDTGDGAEVGRLRGG